MVIKNDNDSGIDTFIFIFKKYYLLILTTLILSAFLGFYFKNLFSSGSDKTYKFEFFILEQYQNQYYQYEYTLDALQSANIKFNINYGYQANYKKVQEIFSHRFYLSSNLNLITQEELDQYSITNENFNKFKDSAFMTTDSVSNGFKVTVISNVLISKNFFNEIINPKLINNSINPIKKYVIDKFDNLINEIDKLIIFEERSKSSIEETLQYQIKNKEYQIKNKASLKKILPKINSLEDCLKHKDFCLYVVANNIFDETPIDDNNIQTNENQKTINLIANINNKIDKMNKCVYDSSLCSEGFDYTSLSDLNKIQSINERINELKKLKMKLYKFESVEPIIYNDKINLNIVKNYSAPFEFILPLLTTLLIIIILSLYEFLISRRLSRDKINKK
jgi:hypothetical protein